MPRLSIYRKLQVGAKRAVGRVRRSMPGPEVVTFPKTVYGGLRMRIHDDRDKVISPFLRSGPWGRFETFCVWNMLRRGSVLYDIGANIGWYTVVCSRRVGPRGRVLAFEPDVDNFRLLKRNVEENLRTNVKFFHAAVADRVGEGSLFRSSVNMGDHRFESPEAGREEARVAVVSLDALIDAGEPVPDFIKIDTQGSEVKALKSLPRLMALNPDLALAIEFWPFGLARAGSTIDELIGILEGVPLRFYRIVAGVDRLVPVDLRQLAMSLTGQDFADILAVPVHRDLPRRLKAIVNAP